jgi:hypothetical protein
MRRQIHASLPNRTPGGARPSLIANSLRRTDPPTLLLRPRSPLRGDVMPGVADDLTVNGVNWMYAMEAAERALARAEDQLEKKVTMNPDFVSGNCAMAQAWI